MASDPNNVNGNFEEIRSKTTTKCWPITILVASWSYVLVQQTSHFGFNYILHLVSGLAGISGHFHSNQNYNLITHYSTKREKKTPISSRFEEEKNLKYKVVFQGENRRASKTSRCK